MADNTPTDPAERSPAADFFHDFIQQVAHELATEVGGNIDVDVRADGSLTLRSIAHASPPVAATTKSPFSEWFPWHTKAGKKAAAAVTASRCAVTASDVNSAVARSEWAHVKCLHEDSEYFAPNKTALLTALPHIATAAISYVHPTFECRNFASLFCCIFTGAMRVSAVAKTLDFTGGHSYNLMVVVDDEGPQRLGIVAIEPQLDRLVVPKGPRSHYTADGKEIAIWGG